MIVYEGDHGLNRRSSSAWAKYAEACAGSRWPGEAPCSRAPAPSSARARRSKDLPERPDPARPGRPSCARSVAGHPILAAIETIAAHCEACSPRCSITSRTGARALQAKTSVAPLLVHGPILSRVGASANPGRFRICLEHKLADGFWRQSEAPGRRGAAHQSATHPAQGDDDDHASRSGTRWYGSCRVVALWTRSWARASSRCVLPAAIPPATLRGRWAVRGVEVVKADLLDPVSLRSALEGRTEPSSSPTSGIPHRCHVRPRSAWRPCKPPAPPGSSTSSGRRCRQREADRRARQGRALHGKGPASTRQSRRPLPSRTAPGRPLPRSVVAKAAMETCATYRSNRRAPALHLLFDRNRT